MGCVWGIAPISDGMKACAAMLVGGALTFAAAGPAVADTGIPNRAADPVVLTANQTPRLIGADPDDVVAFTWDGGWVQVPVQVDERKRADYRVIRQRSMSSAQFTEMVYADPDTWTGADGVPQRPTGNPVSGTPIPGTTGARTSMSTTRSRCWPPMPVTPVPASPIRRG